MATLKHVILDVLKPHQPSILELARSLTDAVPACRVHIHVEEVDEKTESVTVVVAGEDVPYDTVAAKIAEMGGSVHSIDEVEMVGADFRAAEMRPILGDEAEP